MKIGLDAKRAFLNNTGLGNYSRSIILSLLEHYPQHQYYLFTTEIQKNEFYHQVSSHPNVNIIKPSFRFFGFWWRNFGIPQIVNKLELDVYHGLSNELPYNIKKSKAVKIVTIHDLIPFKEDAFRNPFEDFLYKTKMSRACKSANTVVAISKATREDIIHYFGVEKNKIKVIYQPLVFHPGTGKTDIVEKYRLPDHFILQVGTVEYRKNIQIIIRAMIKLKDPNLHFVIVGEKKRFWKSLSVYGAHNGLEKHLHFIGPVDHDELVSFYDRCLAVMYPSMYEGFGLPIVEAIHYGKPVLTTQGSCFEEAGGPGAFYCDTSNVDAVAESIGQILKIPHAATLEAGKQHISQFNTKNAADAFMEVYSK